MAHPQTKPAPPRSAASDLAAAYSRFFEALPADTPELREAAFRLRYQVYCVEHDFLPAAENPGGRETDRFDAHSVHAVLRHRPTGLVAGTTRLVLPRLGAVSGTLPVLEVCPEIADRVPLDRTVEFSRFAISKEFRRRAGDDLYGRFYAEDELSGRRILPHITLGLMTVALRMARSHTIEYVCAIMEPALMRLVARFGMSFRPIGPMVDYHGLRQPCYTGIGELLAGVERERPDLWEAITIGGRLWPEASVGIGSRLLRPRRD